ncbi:hypothetical protein INT45_005287 [Circinella minor]|uniref:Transposase domain-containing protein n=1 Tax=Circinella minor TaxID=1195481 RepID=A0A8H7SA24_9FUNG|nr:hypothetical protein INT45_005287 [Circinella minor]
MSSPGLEILTDLPSTEFQCNICLYVFEKRTISEKIRKNNYYYEEDNQWEDINEDQPIIIEEREQEQEESEEEQEEEEEWTDNDDENFTYTNQFIQTKSFKHTQNYTAAKKYNFNKQKYAETRGEKFSKKNFALATKHSVSQGFYDEIIQLFNGYIKDKLIEPLLSHHLSKKLMENTYPIKPKLYDCCRKGCMMFQRVSKKEKCDFCNEPRSREELLYRSKYQSVSGNYSDVFDGNTYKNLKKDGHFSNPMDIAISLYTDGFTLFNKQQLTIIHVVVLNIDPIRRYETNRMFQICIAPGPLAPCSLFSFLHPTIQSLKRLQESGICVKGDDGKSYYSRVYMLLATGDIPACSKMMCARGHTFRCRFCEILGGAAPNTKGEKRGMYFVPDKRVRPCMRPLKDFQEGNIDKGILRPSPFHDLYSYNGSVTYGLDSMYLIGLGIAKQLWKLICGKYGEKGNPFFLRNSIRKTIGQSLANSRKTIPSTFSNCTIDILQQAGYLRSIDYIHLVCLIAPTLIAEMITNKEAKTTILALESVCNITFKKTITDDDLKKLKKDVDVWLQYLKSQVDNKNINVKSRSATGVSAGNIMVALAAQRYVEQIGIGFDYNIKKLHKQEVLTDLVDDNAREIWGPYWNDIVTNYNEYNLKQALTDYWSVHVPNFKSLNTRIEIGSRLWINEQEMVGSAYRERNEDRRDDYFVKLLIEVDTDRRRRTMENETRLLALVKVWETTVPKPKGYPYLHPRSSSKFFVTSAYDIECFAEKVSAPSKRSYIILWPSITKLNPADVPKLTHLYWSYSS